MMGVRHQVAEVVHARGTGSVRGRRSALVRNRAAVSARRDSIVRYGHLVRRRLVRSF